MKKYTLTKNGIKFEVRDCGKNGWALFIESKRVMVAFDQMKEGILLAFVGALRKK